MSDEKHYTNGEITVVWRPSKCQHAGLCVRGLPTVFNTSRKPWIDMRAETTEAIMHQVSQCPSGALSFYYNQHQPQRPVKEGDIAPEGATHIEVVPDGPLLVHGPLRVTGEQGEQRFSGKVTAFCRCGLSDNKPLCDGSHIRGGFKG